MDIAYLKQTKQIIQTPKKIMPQVTGLDRPTKSKNNPHGELINCSAMLPLDDWQAFNELCETQCVTKAAVVRAFVRQFVQTGEIPGRDF